MTLNKTINYISLYTKNVTTFQKRALCTFAGLMILDFAITTYGYLFYPGFVEGNPLFSRFYNDPMQFIGMIAFLKIVVIIFVVAAVVWFNKKEKEYNMWHGGNVIAATSMCVMVFMMLGLLIFNIVMRI